MAQRFDVGTTRIGDIVDSNARVLQDHYFVEEFPTTASGKIQKYRLREQAAEDLA